MNTHKLRALTRGRHFFPLAKSRARELEIEVRSAGAKPIYYAYLRYASAS